MLKTLLKCIYFRIYVSKLIADLRSFNELYPVLNYDEYLQKAAFFYADLVKVSQMNYGNESGLPNDQVTSIFSNHSELLLKLEGSISNRNAEAIYQLTDNIQQFLDRLYDAARPNKKTTKRLKYSVAASGIFVFVLLITISFSPLKEKYLEEKEEYNLLANEEAYKARTLKDIAELKGALQKYFDDNKGYPASSGGFDAILATWGESKADWIPGLAPRYISQLPVDPRKSKDSRKQYMYKSDGKDFKLIAHNPIGIEEVIRNHPELVDPARPSWSFGIWSEGGKNW